MVSDKKHVQLVVLTGMSGSGKSTALNAFEDMGFYCVDNLPVPLVPEFLRLHESVTDSMLRIAIVMDVRARDFIDRHAEILTSVKDEGFHVEVIFLDARDDVLVQRYSQTRRRHPLRNRDIVSAISEERNMMLELKEYADRILDTSTMNVHQLRQAIINLFSSRESLSQLFIHIVSFGFKYGIPADANMVFDVRFLPNPYFVPELKNMSGCDREVGEYVLENPVATSFLEHLRDMIKFLLPCYRREGKAYFVFAIGCTGGRHRSVAVAEWMKRFMTEEGEEVTITHRDIKREGMQI